AAEQLEYARLCAYKRLHAAGARFYGEAFALDPSLADATAHGHRYNAACAAALAGCGQGKGADKLDAETRARLRRRALDWLREDQVAWARLLDKQPDRARKVVVQQMQNWLRDLDFNGVHGPDALGKLPEAEREGWRRLWADVAATLARAQG